MKRILLISFTVVITASLSFAADFAPTVMTLTSPAEIEYQFDGTELTVPFTVAGTPAAVWLVINTKGQAENIVAVQNGFLGWHYVNKIDTTVYVSERYQRDPGETTIVWDGNNQDGNAVDAGTYNYYLWAYDDVTTRQLACDFIPLGFDWESQYSYIYELGEDGLPLSQPLIVGSRSWHLNLDMDPDGTLLPYLNHGVHFKWVLGGDPMDLSLLQNTNCYLYVAGDYGAKYESTFSCGGPVFDPEDYNTFYHCCVNVPAKTNTMLKWEFVSDGDAVLDEDWLGWDELTWEDNGEMIGFWSQKPSCWTDREYIYVNSPGLHQKELEWNRLRCVSFEGEEVFDKAMSEWYYPEDPNPHDYINGSFHHMASRTPGIWLIASHTSCMHEMIDTSRIIADPDVSPVDYILWNNANGDYFLDSAYDPAVEPAWFCLADEKTLSMRRDSASIDANGINLIGVAYLGLSSFGVSTQDGSALGYISFADDTIATDAIVKPGGQLCDSGSNYDGLYICGALAEGMVAMGGDGTPEQRTANFIASDSSTGIITNEPGQIAVEEEAQAAFAVDQNSPNPFNPTTSMSFTIPEAKHVNVEIYNVAGQKVDTVVNDFMGAGTHSVVWDASGFSNGVYFYTVKSGDFSQTMKMTLLK